MRKSRSLEVLARYRSDDTTMYKCRDLESGAIVKMTRVEFEAAVEKDRARVERRRFNGHTRNTHYRLLARQAARRSATQLKHWAMDAAFGSESVELDVSFA